MGKRGREDEGSSSAAESDEKKHHHHHKHKHKKHHHHHHHHHKHRSSSSEPKAASTKKVQWGKHGVIGAADRGRMQPEFYAWLAEVKHVDPELLRDRRTQQELWSTFEEDFNTATLPHEKFYSLEAWERSAAAAAGGAAAAAAACDEEEERDILREDEEALQRKRAEKRKAAQLSEVARSFVEMRENEAKIAEMLQQEELRRKQKLLWRTGDVAKAAKIAERLAPDPK